MPGPPPGKAAPADYPGKLLAYNRCDCGGLVMSTLSPARARQEGISTSWHISEPLRPAGRRKTQG